MPTNMYKTIYILNFTQLKLKNNMIFIMLIFFNQTFFISLNYALN
jgi:hypothetical protein